MLFTRLPDKKYLLGIDMGETGCQISYLNTRRLSADMDPHTFSREPGSEAYEIPYAAVDAQPLEEGAQTTAETAQTPALATERFLRYCLECMKDELLPEEVEAVTFTAREMDERTSKVLEEAAGRIWPDLTQLRFEEHVHSFYHYILMQDEEQRRENVMLVDGTESSRIRVVTLSFNKKTKPIVCIPDQKICENTDEALFALASPMIQERKYTAAYLTGRSLTGGRMERSLDMICRGRRAFQGDNLYSKGAAYSAMIAGGLASRANRYFYLGADALRCNIGIKCRQKTREVCVSMLEAGTDWYDARASVDVLAGPGGSVELVQTTLDRSSSRGIDITLENFPDRPPLTTRLRITLSMRNADTMLLEAEDLGFGEIFPSTGMKWEQEITING